MSADLRKRCLSAVWTRWTSLEDDWRSVVIGAAIVAPIALFDLHVPW